MKIFILIISIIGTQSGRVREPTPNGGQGQLISNDVNKLLTPSSDFVLPPDFAEQLLMDINRIRMCHNAISTGPIVNEACFDDDNENVQKSVRRSGHHARKPKKNKFNQKSKRKRGERRSRRNRDRNGQKS